MLIQKIGQLWWFKRSRGIFKLAGDQTSQGDQLGTTLFRDKANDMELKIDLIYNCTGVQDHPTEMRTFSCNVFMGSCVKMQSVLASPIQDYTWNGKCRISSEAEGVPPEDHFCRPELSDLCRWLCPTHTGLAVMLVFGLIIFIYPNVDKNLLCLISNNKP